MVWHVILFLDFHVKTTSSNCLSTSLARTKCRLSHAPAMPAIRLADDFISTSKVVVRSGDNALHVLAGLYTARL